MKTRVGLQHVLQLLWAMRPEKKKQEGGGILLAQHNSVQKVTTLANWLYTWFPKNLLLTLSTVTLQKKKMTDREIVFANFITIDI